MIRLLNLDQSNLFLQFKVQQKMSQEKETEVGIQKESKHKTNNKKKKDFSNKQSYGLIKTVDENNQTGTISMGKSKEAIFHFKECGKFTPTVGQNVTFSLLEVF
jgi:hypothetical protein